MSFPRVLLNGAAVSVRTLFFNDHFNLVYKYKVCLGVLQLSESKLCLKIQ